MSYEGKILPQQLIVFYIYPGNWTRHKFPFFQQWFLGDHILGYSKPLGENSVTTSHSGCCRDLNGRTSEQPFTTCRLLFSDITGIIEHLLKWLIYLLQLKDFHSIQRGMSCLGVFIMVSPIYISKVLFPYRLQH